MTTSITSQTLTAMVSALTLFGVLDLQAQGTAADWLGRMERALGGPDAIAAIRSLSVTAACTGPDGPFETDVDSFRSRWVRFRQARGGREMTVWSGPESTWTLGADERVAEQDARLRDFVRSHEFHALVLEATTRFTGHRLGGRETVRGDDCRTILMEDETGQSASVCISEATYLPARLEMNPEGAAGPVRIDFEDWESIDGVRFFRGFDLTEGPERTFRYDYRSIRPNAVSALEFIRPLPSALRGSQGELATLLEEDRVAHLNTDAARLTANIADTLVEISSGAIRRQSRAEIEELFTRQFEGATYHRWEDTEPPRIVISADQTLAWTARRVEVHRSARGRDGHEIRRSFVSAYSSTYRKQNGAWKMTSVTSTFVPDPQG